MKRFSRTIHRLSADQPNVVRLYTDGSCSHNGHADSVGGAALILQDMRSGKKLRKAVFIPAPCTSNQAELQAVIQGLKLLKKPCIIQLITDSEYVALGLSERLPGMVARNFRGAANQLCWEELYKLSLQHDIYCVWVKSHAANELNNECDKMAKNAWKKPTAGLEGVDEQISQ